MQLCFGASTFPIHFSPAVHKPILSNIPLEQSTALIQYCVAKSHPERIHLLHFDPGGQNNQQMDFHGKSLPSFNEVEHCDTQ